MPHSPGYFYTELHRQILISGMTNKQDMKSYQSYLFVMPYSQM